MAANRSRTENWKQSLAQIAERGGGIEVAVKVDHLQVPGSDVIWRVRLLECGEKELVIEQPAFVETSFPLASGTELVAGMCIGQNRWMFTTRVIGQRAGRSPSGRTLPGLVLALPEKVERCSRRESFRVSTAEFSLPTIECWPLVDPTSAVAAEVANRQQITDAFEKVRMGLAPGPEGSILLPEVGPGFGGKLLNVSGGGLGLLFTHDQTPLLERQSFVWMRVSLRPFVPLPVALTTRRVHTHMDASQHVHGGFAFDFSFHAEHQEFIMNVFDEYVQGVQAQQRSLRYGHAA